MTEEEFYTRVDDDLQLRSDDEEIVVRNDRTSVKEMILRFEKTSMTNLTVSTESLEKAKEIDLRNLTSVVNPIQLHLQNLYPVNKSQDRHSNVSVNSILSNVSEISYESNSSGFVSDRKSGVDWRRPHRPAPPPPEPFNDSSSLESKSPVPEVADVPKERKYSFTTPNSSPIVMRRMRQPPVIRRKSIVSGQGHLGEAHWSYGVTQGDLEKLLRLKRSEVSDNEEEHKTVSTDSTETDSSSGDSTDSDKSDRGQEYILNNDDAKADTLSADHSTDTLINEECSDEGDYFSVASGGSGERSNYDNVSIKSISSFDMVPYQKYDSITVSSDEFGSEVCHAPNTEFLTVSAVNEWCVTKSAEPVLLPVESKKEKYRR